jgi:hypothetical protein
MRKPPDVPMPRTGGGMTTRTRPSWIEARRWNRAPWIAAALFLGSRARTSNGSSGRNIAPEFGALVKVAPEKPAKFTAWTTPGTCKAVSTTCRLTASVRASEAPLGSCVTTIR